MKKLGSFSFARWWAIVLKEFLQLKRDKVTFAMMIGIPIMQLALFGFAINTDPKHLPTAVVSTENSEFTRTLVAAMKISEYFDIKDEFSDEIEAKEALKQGKIQFILTIPPDFTRKLLRLETPSILLEADATDPIATSAALSSIGSIASQLQTKDFNGVFSSLRGGKQSFDIRVHRLYNPEGITQYNIVPGLMGVIMTMTLAMMTALAITREREKGTMENLLATPAKPIEIMTGKIVPYIFIGLIQSSIILLAAHIIFAVPFEGSIIWAYTAIILFIAVNLTIGITISSIAQNMLQALQLTFFYFFAEHSAFRLYVSFLGMPKWAQFIGEFLPLTYFNRLIRGVVLKGNGFAELWPNMWPLMLISVVTMVLAVRFYKKTLD